jgi:uncharacterized protein (TIGR02117 family)
MRGAIRFGVRLLAALLLLIVLYLIAALGFALLPVSGRPQQAESEPVVYVCTSLTHADIVLPSHDPLIDWSALFPTVVRPNLPDEAYLAFGWGDLRFFRETPSWADVRPAIALSALVGLNDTALRVMAVNPPVNNPECMPLAVDRAGRQALIDHIRATFADETPAAQDRLEAYYIAKGRYSPLRTCNQWVAEGLAAAGLPYARFAPFSFSINWPLETLQSPPGRS